VTHESESRTAFGFYRSRRPDLIEEFLMKKDSAALALLATGMIFQIACLPAAAQTAGRDIVLKGALLIDGTGRAPIENSVLVIREGKILAAGKAGTVPVPKDADERDLAGKTIIPALTNLHGHIGLTTNGSDSAAGAYTEENVARQLQKYLSYGVGAVASFGQDADLIYALKEKQSVGKLPGARVYTAGRGFAEANPHPNPADIRYRPNTPEQARADVVELAAHHPDYVKMWVDDSLGHSEKMKPEIYRAIIDEAHRHQLRVFAHEFYLADAKDLLRAGLDGFAHSIRDQPVDEELIRMMKSRGVFLIPTLVRDEVLFVYTEKGTWTDDPFFQAGLEPGVLAALRAPELVEKNRRDPDLEKYKAGLEMAKKNLKTLSDAGVKIAFGTDSGVVNRFSGYFEHRELQLMVEAGLTPMQTIVAATATNASILRGDKDFGTLQPGRRADFLVLDANPLADIHNTEKLAAVWQAGRIVSSVSARQK
jgi:imidazolonepropionase-like amidohydrolase